MPDASHGMTVDPDLSFTKGLEIQERVTYFLQRELTLEVATIGNDSLVVFHLHTIRSHRRLDSLIVVGHRADDPMLEGIGHLMSVLLCLQLHVTGDTLEVLDGASEINAPHGLHENIQHVAFLHGRQHQ